MLTRRKRRRQRLLLPRRLPRPPAEAEGTSTLTMEEID